MMSNWDNLSYFSSPPQLIMLIEPETKIRFRYKSEGGSHGGLPGKLRENGKKTYPTVKLENYHGNKKVFVKISLYTEDKKEHVLEFKGKKSENGKQYIKEYLKEDNTAVFTNVQILSKKKDEIEEILLDRKIKNFKEGITDCTRNLLEKTYRKEVKERAKAILNSARLYFEAFEEDNDVPLCSLFSDVICNQKAASKGDLKISRLSQVSGSWKGGDDIILLCDKVQKENIKVRFYEADDSGNIIWQDYGKFLPSDVHYQVAIPFKTPQYHKNIKKQVFICLERDEEISEAREFTYIPDEVSSKKRKHDTAQSEVPLSSEIDSSMSGSSNDEGSSNWITQSLASLAEFEETSVDISDSPESLSDFVNQEGSFSVDINFLCNFLENDYELPFESIIYPHDMDEHFGPYDGIQTDMGTIQELLSKCTIKDMTENKSTNSFIKSCTEEDETIRHSNTNFQIIKSVCSSLLSKRDKFGNTLLHLAVLQNKNVLLILKMSYISKHNIINVQNCKKLTAFHLATEKNRDDLMKSFIYFGANPNLSDIEGNNCYHIAALNNCCEALKKILTFCKYSSGLNDFNHKGLTPLHIAIMKSSEQCFHLLMSNRADVAVVEKKSGRSLLHYAVEFQPLFAQELIDMSQVDVNSLDFYGNTPLHIACATENIFVVKQLLQAGADPLLKNYKQNSNTLEETEDASDGQLPADLTTDVEILKILQNATETDEQLVIQNYDHVAGLNELQSQTIERLCNYLDQDMKWKAVACYFIDHQYVESLLISNSPTKALLNHIKKEQRDSYIESFKSALKIANLDEGVKIIEEHA